jgi:hypothetical protein
MSTQNMNTIFRKGDVVRGKVSGNLYHVTEADPAFSDGTQMLHVEYIGKPQPFIPACLRNLEVTLHLRPA